MADDPTVQLRDQGQLRDEMSAATDGVDELGLGRAAEAGSMQLGDGVDVVRRFGPDGGGRRGLGALQRGAARVVIGARRHGRSFSMNCATKRLPGT